MKQFLLLSLAAVCLTVVGVIAGCGDDESSNPQLAVGDTTNADFQLVREAVDEADFGGMTEYMLMFAVALMDSVMDEGGAPLVSGREMPTLALQDSLLMTYHAGTRYWYLYASQAEGTDTMVVTDSVQFLHATGPVQWPDTTLLTGINTGVRVRLASGTEVLIDVGQRLSLMGDIIHGGDATINGIQSYHFTMNSATETDTCEVAYNGTASFAGIELNLQEVFGGGACPTSGQAVYVIDLFLDCTSGDSSIVIDGTWRVVQTFAGTTVTVAYEDGTTRWTVTDDCGSAPAKAGNRFEELLGRQQ